MSADLVKVKELFLAVLEMPAPERTAHLDTACAGDAALRRQIEAMLQSHQHSGELLPRSPAAMLADSGATDADATSAFAPQADPSATPGEQAPGEPNDLSFLAPSAKPEYLGRLGHYEVKEVIGKGGFGIVLRAFDERLHRVVAIKVLAPAYAANGSARKRFIREARAAAAVKNEHVVGIYDVQENAQPPYLVMECIDGIALQDKIDQQGTLGVKEVLRIGMQMAEGLAAAHKQGIVHRDIKPANILLENGVERVKITDFGLARAVDDASVTQSGTVAGTPMYMSPEQAEGIAIDHRSDLFSLGTVLYAMCTGHPPFRASGTHAVLKRVIDASPRPMREINSEIPDWLCAIIAKLHAKKPEDRYATAKEVAELLGQHLAHLQQPTLVARPTTAALPSPISQHATAIWTHQRRAAAVALAALGVVITYAGLMLFKLPAQRVSPPGVQWLVAGLGLALLLGAVFLAFNARRWRLGAAAALLVVLAAALVVVRGVRSTDSGAVPPNEVKRNNELNANGIAYDLPFPDPNDQAHIVTALLKAVTATGVKWSNDTLSLEVIHGAVTLNGKSYGTVKQGDRVKLTAEGLLFVNGSERKPAPVAGAAANGWVQLFNGKDLTGWKTHPDQPGNWNVKDGILTGRGNTSHLFSQGRYYNFHLRAEVMIEQGYSGIYFRAGYNLDHISTGVNRAFPVGNEARIVAFAGGLGTGSLKNAPVRKSLMDPKKWFTLEIIAENNHLVTMVNGEKAADHLEVTEQFQKGHLALQCGGDAIPNVVHFRKIEIKELPPTFKDDKERLQGQWVAVDFEEGGRNQKEGLNVVQWFFTFTGDRCHFMTRAGGKVSLDQNGLFLTDLGANPKRFRLVMPSDEKQVRQLIGIYEFQGEYLRMCYGGHPGVPVNVGYPTAFATKAGSPLLMVTLKRLPAAEPGWVQLFNGKDLSGWKTLLAPEVWRVKDGILVGGGDKGYLVTEREFENFQFRVKAKFGGKMDSGQWFRFKPGPHNQAYEAQIGGDTGTLLRIDADGPILLFRNKDNSVPADTWFTQEVIAKGNRLIVMLNGETVADVVDERYRRGHLALQSFNKEGTVFFSKIEIKELPPTYKDDKERLQGRWVAESIETVADGKEIKFEVGKVNGQPMPKNLSPTFTLTFTGNKIKADPVLAYGQKRTDEAIFYLDEKASPKKIDLIDEERKGQFGIYRFDGDRLVLCIGDDGEKNRPTAFTPKGGNKRMLVVFKKNDIKELPPEENGFVPLFNGKDLTGWRVVGTPRNSWQIRDGMIWGGGAQTYLVSERKFTNFHLKAEVRVSPGCEGRILCRADPTIQAILARTFVPVAVKFKQHPLSRGISKLEAQLCLQWEQVGPLTDTFTRTFKADQWVGLDLIAKGDRVTATVVVAGVPNELSTQVDPARQLGPGPIMLYLGTKEGSLECRKIEIKELPPVQGPPTAVVPHGKEK